MVFGFCRSSAGDAAPRSVQSIGIAFPIEQSGAISTTAVGKRVMAAAAGGEKSELGAAILAERDWRHNYPRHFVELEATEIASYSAAFRMANAGLASIYREFQFAELDSDGQPKATPLSEALPSMVAADESALHTIRIQGQAIPATLDAVFGASISEDALREGPPEGTAEPSVKSSVEELLQAELSSLREPGDRVRLTSATMMPQTPLQELLSKHVFVLIGGTSELCPYSTLTKLGATVVVIARKGPKLARLLKRAKQSAAGTVVSPTTASLETDGAQFDADGADSANVMLESVAENAGVDVIAKAPELTVWLSRMFPDKMMVLGCYIYLDGEAHVRASVAMDIVVDGVVNRRAPGTTAVTYIGSPATAHLISQEAYEESTARYNRRSWHHAPMGYMQNNRAGSASDGKVQCQTITGTIVERTMTDGYSVFQGPNYALAKKIQMWRSTLLLQRGVGVSVNMAPPSRTESVIHSAQAKAGHPAEIVVAKSFHGGSARCAYKADSIGTTAFVIGKLGLA